jgi:phosphatidylserine/phosphatidylglycerophosphate/cardiolipin synthase-like enzyme
VKDELLFSRDGSIQPYIEQLLDTVATSVEAALYRLNNPALARGLERAWQRGVQVRLVLDRNKFEDDRATRHLLAEVSFPWRLLYGRAGRGSKMHHKIALFDSVVALTGSYNWTLESERENYENLLVLRAPEQLAQLRREFEALWNEAREFRPLGDRASGLAF